MPDRSLILLSGGPDSTTLAKWAPANGHKDIHHVFYRSGRVEDNQAIKSADALSKELGAPLEIIDLEHVVGALGSGVIMIHSEASIMPFGNAIAMSIAVTYAKKIQANKILVGIHADDAAESPEYRRQFFDGMQALAQSTQGDIEILTPFIDLTKSEVFRTGTKLGVEFVERHSGTQMKRVH